AGGDPARRRARRAGHARQHDQGRGGPGAAVPEPDARPRRVRGAPALGIGNLLMHLAEWPAYTRVPLDVVAAEGHELLLADGRRVLDLYGGHCVNTLGAGDVALGRVL